MTDLGLEYAALSRAAGTISTVFDELTGAGQTLDGRAAGFLGDGWQGAAAAAFREGYDEWQAGSREVLASLIEMGQLIHDANNRFGMVDLAVDGSMLRLHSRLGEGGQ